MSEITDLAKRVGSIIPDDYWKKVMLVGLDDLRPASIENAKTNLKKVEQILTELNNTLDFIIEQDGFCKINGAGVKENLRALTLVTPSQPYLEENPVLAAVYAIVGQHVHTFKRDLLIKAAKIIVDEVYGGVLYTHTPVIRNLAYIARYVGFVYEDQTDLTCVLNDATFEINLNGATPLEYTNSTDDSVACFPIAWFSEKCFPTRANTTEKEAICSELLYKKFRYVLKDILKEFSGKEFRRNSLLNFVADRLSGRSPTSWRGGTGESRFVAKLERFGYITPSGNNDKSKEWKTKSGKTRFNRIPLYAINSQKIEGALAGKVVSPHH